MKISKKKKKNKKNSTYKTIFNLLLSSKRQVKVSNLILKKWKNKFKNWVTKMHMTIIKIYVNKSVYKNALKLSKNNRF